MPNCVTCGDELHPERAEKYDYCIKPECQERNARGFEVVAVGVNKAADQYVLLTERTREEMAGGRYKKQPELRGSARMRRRMAPRLGPASVPAPPPAPPPLRPRWSEAQENLTLIYRGMGMQPDQIAEKLGVSRYLVTQILLAATKRPHRPGRPGRKS